MNNTFADMVERMKDVLSNEIGGKVCDKNVAFSLEIEPAVMANMKYKNRIPYDAVTGFCIEKRVSVNWMLFGIGPMEMKDAAKSL
ncbi:hypothetical protein WCX72_09905 [Sulfurimonas sp. HSL1-6]|uniref:hypothetical protein n=1 Tax=Thiomicrolovo immobilis TaxID=3131935 RepID=UPI0031F8F9B5